MAINDRQFAAAHDRYLEPPDDGPFGEVGEYDEMYLAAIERQAQIDKEEWLAEQLRQRQEDLS